MKEEAKLKKQKFLKDVVKKVYKKDVDVDFKSYGKEKYTITLKHNTKEYKLTEVLSRGLTKYAIAEIEGVRKQFDRYVDAERYVMDLMEE